ncbi:MAG: OmpW family outer membrane protein [Pseudomonadota bacterium]
MKSIFLSMTAVLIAGIMAVATPVPGALAQESYRSNDVENQTAPSEKSQTPFDQERFSSSPIPMSISVQALSKTFPHIVLYSYFYDQNGNPISGLSANDISIDETSSMAGPLSAETVACFLEKPGTDIQSGITFSLVVDMSASMIGIPFDKAKQAAVQLLNDCSIHDRVSLVSFSTGGLEAIQSPVDWVGSDGDGNGTYDIIDAVNGLAIIQHGNTAVFDGTAKGIDSLASEPAPKFVVIFSDGLTNSDISYDINQVIAKAISEQVRIFSIGIGYDSPRLRTLAETTGGTYRFSPDIDGISAIYQEMYQLMVKASSSRYTICYTSQDPRQDGSTRTVTVTHGAMSGSTTYTVNDSPSIVLDSTTLGLTGQMQPPGQPITLSGTIQDNDAQLLGQTLTASIFSFRPDGSRFMETPLTLTDSGNGIYAFSHAISSTDVQSPGIEYYVHASDGTDETVLPGEYLTVPFFIPVTGSTPPVIVHTPVVSGTADQAIGIQANVTDNDIARVFLYFRLHDPYAIGPYHTLEMTGTGPFFTVEIPPYFATTTGIDYFISAWDGSLARTDHGSSSQPHFIRINGINYQFPLADAGHDRTGAAGQTITLDGSGSRDPDPGDTLAYEWRQTGGAPVTLLDRNSVNPRFVAPRIDPGNRILTFELSVMDSTCLRGTDSVSITINNNGPKADFSWNPAAPTTGVLVGFTDMSTAEVPIVSWLWDFGGLGTSNEQNPSFTFNAKRVVTVTLKVTDQNGMTDTLSHTVTVLCSGQNCGSGGGGCFISTLAGKAGLPGFRSITNHPGTILFGAVVMILGLGLGLWKRRRIATLVLALVIPAILWTAGSPRCENLPGFTVSILGGAWGFDRSQDIDLDTVMGAALGYNFNDRIGVEAMVDHGTFEHDFYNTDTCECDVDNLSGTVSHLDLLWHFRPESQVVPYLAAGMGRVDLNYDRFDKTSENMANVGGGVKLFLSDTLALRGDIRYIRTFDNDYRNMVVNLGIMFQFPFKKSPAVQMAAAEPEPVSKHEPAPPKEKALPPAAPAARPEPPAPVIPAALPTKRPEPVIIDLKILFDFDKTIIKPSYYSQIEDLAQMLAAHPDINLTIQGHTCNIGSEAYNQKLSLRRAESVKTFLVDRHGVNPDRISVAGYGETRPETDNKTPASRKLNRRAIIVNMVN